MHLCFLRRLRLKERILVLLLAGLSGCLVFAFLVVTSTTTNTTNAGVTLNENAQHSVDNAGDGFLIDDGGAADTVALYRSFTQSRRLGAKDVDEPPTSSSTSPPPLGTDVMFSPSAFSPSISTSRTYRRSAATKGAHWQAKWRQQLDAVLNDNNVDGGGGVGGGDTRTTGSDDSRRTAPDNDEGEDFLLISNNNNNNNIVNAVDPDQQQLIAASPHSALKGKPHCNSIFLPPSLPLP